MKIEVQHDFEVPEKYKDFECINIGGYKIIFNLVDGVIIIGKKEFNLFQSKICHATLFPCTKEKLEKEGDFDSSISSAFNLKDDIIYFYVTYGDHAYIFDNIEDAIQMVSVMTQVKAQALTYKN